MSDEVAERMVQGYMGTNQPTYSFGWQGGEPTLMGLDFFKKIVELQKKHGPSGAQVANGLQTNVTLIDDEFAAFLGEYHFLIGASIDGPPHLHDPHRVTINGNGSHKAVLAGVEALERNKVEYNALILINSLNVNHPKEIYDYLLDLGIRFHQYIPCVEFDDKGHPLPYTITGDQWGEFLVQLYDRWIPTDTRTVSIRDFDAVLGQMVDGSYSMCVQAGNCCSYFVVEYNGDVYPCDFFVEPSAKIGNLMRDDWHKLQSSSKYRGFGSQKCQWHEDCKSCDFLRYCSGDCLKQRFYGGREPSSLSWLCSGWERFYQHTVKGFEELALSVMRERQLSQPPQMRRRIDRIPQIKIGWNDPCFCGSGKKYRLCHGFAASDRNRNTPGG